MTTATTTAPAPVSTPWGIPDDSHTIAPGIVSYHTPSHGGIWLSPDRLIEFMAKFPHYAPFAGAPWFEEDEDCGAVVLAFPDHFCDEAVFFALSYAISRPDSPNWSGVVDWLLLHGSDVTERSEAFQEAHKNHWMSGGLSSMVPKSIKSEHPEYWSVNLRRGDERKVVAMPYPLKSFHLDEEIADFPVITE